MKGKSLVYMYVGHGYIMKGKSLVYMYVGLRWLHAERKVFSLLVHWSKMVTY